MQNQLRNEFWEAEVGPHLMGRRMGTVPEDLIKYARLPGLGTETLSGEGGHLSKKKRRVAMTPLSSFFMEGEQENRLNQT